MRIRQLEWVNEHTWYADSVIGTYAVWTGYYRPPRQKAGIPAGSTIESAKAAAQAHFESVIMSAIEQEPTT